MPLQTQLEAAGPDLEPATAVFVEFAAGLRSIPLDVLSRIIRLLLVRAACR